MFGQSLDFYLHELTTTKDNFHFYPTNLSKIIKCTITIQFIRKYALMSYDRLSMLMINTTNLFIACISMNNKVYKTIFYLFSFGYFLFSQEISNRDFYGCSNPHIINWIQKYHNKQ